MATLQDWIDRTRSHLLSGHQEQRNLLSADYVAGSGTLSFSGVMNGIVDGTRLSIGWNTFYVLSVTGQTASVVAGQAGSFDANAPTGTLVRVSPMVTDWEITQALQDELADLSAPDNGLYQMLGLTITYNAGQIGYDLTGFNDIIDIYDVRPRDSGTALSWQQMGKFEWRLDRTADETDFPSGMSLQVFGEAVAGLGLRVLYKAGFTLPSLPSTDVLVSGLPESAMDIPPLGAAMRIMAPREIKRNRLEVQSDTRRAAEVPPGAVLNSYRGLALLRQQRIMAEAGRLAARYPAKMW